MSYRTTISGCKWIFELSAIIILLAVALIYWPVVHAQFIWDDILDFQKSAWLRHGDDWQSFLLHRFNDWISYFRPLVVALFTIEVRAFDVQPGPMHAVSLSIHLINTLLVGILAVCMSADKLPRAKRIYLFTLPMLLYGLHPMLIEPVVWIGCQFDLVSMMFMLLGWTVNASIKRSITRAASVSICFFLAACSKESAAAFPFVLIVFDWFAFDTPRSTSKIIQLRQFLGRNGATYAATLVAGFAYLAFRYWALSGLMPYGGGDTHSVLGRLQEICFVYLRYWRMFFWPTIGMGPVHPVAASEYLAVSGWSLLRDGAALGIVLAGVGLAFRRFYAGGLILAVTFALLPVLHIIAAGFDANLYHERYAMPALAMACAWLPLTLMEIQIPARIRRTISIAAYVTLIAWMLLAVLTIRETVPLWSSQVTLWQWAVKENPTSVGAKDELISAYIGQGSYTAAWQVIDELVANNVSCMNCMLNAASLAVKENNASRASFFLQRIKNSPELYTDRATYRFYLNTIAQLELLQGNSAAAEKVAKSAIAMDNLDPEPQHTLAVALALQGKITEAEQVEDAAISLVEPSERQQQHQRFESLLSWLRSHPAKNP